MEMRMYHLRYEGKGNIEYTERSNIDRRNVRKEPKDSFGKKLEEMIRKLTKKSIDAEITSW